MSAAGIGVMCSQRWASVRAWGRPGTEGVHFRRDVPAGISSLNLKKVLVQKKRRQGSEKPGEDCSAGPSWRVIGVWAQKRRADRWQEERPGCAHSLSPPQQLGGFEGPEGSGQL